MPRPRKTPEVALPPITDAEREALKAAQENAAKQEPAMKAASATRTKEPAPFGPGATYPRMTFQTRLYHPELNATVQYSANDCTMDVFVKAIHEAIAHGWYPCQSPDAPRLEPEPEPEPEPAARRTGSRTQQPKQNALVLPFGKYRGQALQAIERVDPDYVDWLADNANMSDIRKAAQKLRNLRDDEPF